MKPSEGVQDLGVLPMVLVNEDYFRRDRPGGSMSFEDLLMYGGWVQHGRGDRGELTYMRRGSLPAIGNYRAFFPMAQINGDDPISVFGIGVPGLMQISGKSGLKTVQCYPASEGSLLVYSFRDGKKIATAYKLGTLEELFPECPINNPTEDQRDSFLKNWRAALKKQMIENAPRLEDGEVLPLVSEPIGAAVLTTIPAAICDDWWGIPTRLQPEFFDPDLDDVPKSWNYAYGDPRDWANIR